MCDLVYDASMLPAGDMVKDSPCFGCKYEGDCDRQAIRDIPADWSYEWYDCLNYTLIDAGISKNEALGMKLWDE